MKKVIIALVLALGVFAVGSIVPASVSHTNAGTTVTTNTSTAPDPFM